MEKTQIVDKMKAKMYEDFQEFSSNLPDAYQDEDVISQIEGIYKNAYCRGMDNMFNMMKDELLANFA
jgi:hypothetical protein